MKKVLLFVLFLLNIACVSARSVVSVYRDSAQMGINRQNKVELIHYTNGGDNYVSIRFFTKRNNGWILKNKFRFRKDALSPCDPVIADFNNDGLKDISYKSAVAARGSNEVRKLFIYDPQKDQLIYIRNSEDYPNLRYNKKLKCMDSFLVYGGCMTVFLKLRGDLLKQFASVELNDELTVSLYDKNGRQKVIFTDTANKAGYIRYSNYRPLEEAENY